VALKRIESRELYVWETTYFVEPAVYAGIADCGVLPLLLKFDKDPS